MIPRILTMIPRVRENSEVFIVYRSMEILSRHSQKTWCLLSNMTVVNIFLLVLSCCRAVASTTVILWNQHAMAWNIIGKKKPRIHGKREHLCWINSFKHLNKTSHSRRKWSISIYRGVFFVFDVERQPGQDATNVRRVLQIPLLQQRCQRTDNRRGTCVLIDHWLETRRPWRQCSFWADYKVNPS